MEVATASGISQRLFKLMRDTGVRRALVGEIVCNSKRAYSWQTVKTRPLSEFFNKQFNQTRANAVSPTTTTADPWGAFWPISDRSGRSIEYPTTKEGKSNRSKRNSPPSCLQTGCRGAEKVPAFFSMIFEARSLFRYLRVSRWLYSSSKWL